MLGRDKFNKTLLRCGQDNFNQITAWIRGRTLVTVMRDTCTATVPPAPPDVIINSMTVGMYLSRAILKPKPIQAHKNVFLLKCMFEDGLVAPGTYYAVCK